MRTPFYLTLLLLWSHVSNAQWSLTKGPEGGEVRSLLTSGTNIYAGTFGGGVHRSADNGLSWTYSGLADKSVFSLARITNEILLAGTSEGLFKSSDSGTTWQLLLSGLPGNNSINDIKIKDDFVFITNTSGVYRSSLPDLAQWDKVIAGLPDTNTGEILVKGNDLYVGVYFKGIYKSSNNGDEWIAVNNGLPVTNVDDLIEHNGDLYTAVYGNGIYRSSDDGGIWEAINTGITDLSTRTIFSDGTMLYVGAYYQVFRSANHGDTWSEVGRPENYFPNVFTLAGADLLVGTHMNGIYRSSNQGDTWSYSSTRLIASQVTALAGIGTTVIAGTAYRGIYSTDDNGETWLRLNESGPETNQINTLFVANDTIYAGTPQGIYCSIDNGDTWIEKTTGISTGDFHAKSFTLKNNELYVCTSLGVYVSVDKGDTWTRLNFDINANDVEVVGDHLFVSTSEGLYQSADGGNLWMRSVSLTEPTIGFIHAMDTILFVKSNSGGLRWSKDEGETWSMSNLEETPTAMTAIGNTLFVSTYEGMFFSQDYGATWTQGNADLDALYLVDMIGSGNFLFAGAARNGVFVREISHELNTSGTLNAFSTESGVPSPPQSFTVTAALSGEIIIDAPETFEISLQSESGYEADLSINSPEEGTPYTVYVRMNTLLIGTASGDITVSSKDAVTQTIPVTGTATKRSQTVMFEPLAPVTYVQPKFKLIATASSGLVVSYTSSDPSVASVEGDSLIITGTGSADITASQPGNDEYSAAAVTRQLIVNKAEQTITFEPFPEKTDTDDPFVLIAFSDSSLPVQFHSSNESVATISGNILTIVGIGVTSITAVQDGDQNFNPAQDVHQTLTVKVAQTINFEELAPKKFGDLPFALDASSSSSLEVTFSCSDHSVATVSGNTVTITGAGTAIISANQSGNSFVAAADPVHRTLAVEKSEQIISFNAITERTLGDGAISLQATSSSGLPVIFSTLSDKISLANDEIILLAAGSVTIYADQPGNKNYSAAPRVSQIFCINPAKPEILSDEENSLFTSDSDTGNQWFLDDNMIAGATGKILIPEVAGKYNLQVTVDGCLSVFSESLQWTIAGLSDEFPGERLVYPNPVNDILQLDLRGLGENVMLEVINSKGQILDVYEIAGDLYRLDVGNYIPDLYYVKIVAGKKTITSKVVKY